VWSAPGLIAAGTLANPSLSYDSENNAIYAFWIDVNTIKYSSRTVTSAAAAWSGAETLAADCNAPGYLGSSSSSPLRIGILWRENYETSYVVKYSTLTLVPAPENPRVDSVFISSIAMKWDSMTSNKGYVVDASTRSDFTGTIHSSITADGNAAALTVFETALSTNTRYYFRVGSLWNSGATSYAASIVSTVTLAAQPGVPAVFTEVFFASVTVSWPDNGNPAYTEYFLWVSTAADFTGTIYYPAGGAQWFTGASAVFIDFCAGRTYYFRAKARNLNNIETSTTELGNTTTATSAFIDCGLRFRDGTGTTITGAGQNISECPAELKLKIQKGNDTYGIATVDEGDPKASKLKIQTPDGPKCIRRYP
ncbi:MAG: hypothetical protein KKH28_07715, partial [Elusimicrobia bacterium]|nr:hypothetical protein [Elusimicrobiota bacterium]